MFLSPISIPDAPCSYIWHSSALTARNLQVLRDDQIDAATETRNLVLVGGAHTNAVAAWLATHAGVPQVPVRHHRHQHRHAARDVGVISGNATSSISVGPCEYTGTDLGMVYTAPGPNSGSGGGNGGGNGRLALVIEATSSRALRSIVRFQFSSSQALTRAAFTNLYRHPPPHSDTPSDLLHLCLSASPPPISLCTVAAFCRWLQVRCTNHVSPSASPGVHVGCAD